MIMKFKIILKMKQEKQIREENNKKNDKLNKKNPKVNNKRKKDHI